MTAAPATFAAVFAALYAAHHIGDHWVQTHHQALTKGAASWRGRLACARHVASLTAVQVVAVAALVPALGVQLNPAAVAAGLAVNAASHWWADRRHTLARLAVLAEGAGINGKTAYYRLGAPRPGRDDNPSLGTGAYHLDQAWHVGWLFPAALIIAGGSA